MWINSEFLKCATGIRKVEAIFISFCIPRKVHKNQHTVIFFMYSPNCFTHLWLVHKLPYAVFNARFQLCFKQKNTGPSVLLEVSTHLQRYCVPVYQNNETNVMHFSFSLLKIKGFYMFRALLAHPQEAVPRLQFQCNRGRANWYYTHAIYQVPCTVCKTLSYLHRNAVKLQVTDTKRSYNLNFHPVPHGVTISC
jgi:hypothetical protein